MAAKAKRYWKYEFESESDLNAALENASPYDAISIAFAEGRMDVKKKSDDPIDISSGQVLFDYDTGRMTINVKGKTVNGKPVCKCPDCNGFLQMQKKFFKIGPVNSPWFYVCSNREKNNCKVVVPAKVNGQLLFIPAGKDVRDARNITTDMFDRLWKEAPDILDWAGDPDEMKSVINKAKARGYRYLAHKMAQMGGKETQLQKMGIEDLRLAYKICRDATIDDVMKFSK